MNIGFDFDGTLLDSSWRHVLALRRIWPEIDDHLGEWPRDFLSFKAEGNSTTQYLAQTHPQLAGSRAAQWVSHIEDADIMHSDKPYRGCFEFLSSLSPIHTLHLATARSRIPETRDQFSRFEYANYFKSMHVVAPGEGASRRKADALLGCNIDLVIGDTESDQEWASYHQAVFIPVAWGFRSATFWNTRKLDPAKNYDDLSSRIDAVQASRA